MANSTTNPCPFCGSTNTYLFKCEDKDGRTLKNAVYVKCEGCGMRGPVIGGNGEGAVAAWNMLTTRLNA